MGHRRPQKRHGQEGRREGFEGAEHPRGCRIKALEALQVEKVRQHGSRNHDEGDPTHDHAIEVRQAGGHHCRPKRQAAHQHGPAHD